VLSLAEKPFHLKEGFNYGKRMVTITAMFFRHLKPPFAKWLEETFGEVFKFNDPPPKK